MDREVIIAKSAGFCFGVKRAVNEVEEQILDGSNPLYTFGPIIHNEEVTNSLAERGVRIIDSVDELQGLTPGRVVIRSHGISRAQKDALESCGMEIIDATCPFVTKIHRAVEKHSDEGEFILIIGNDGHPEIEGIKGWCNGPFLVASEADDIDFSSLPMDKSIFMVSQTTFKPSKFKELVEIVQNKGYTVICLNTICNATEERQSEAEQIAADVDAMVVVGGKHSSNTAKLYEICKNRCENTYLVQTARDLDPAFLTLVSKIGITAGASTPDYIIKEVQKLCQK